MIFKYVEQDTGRTLRIRDGAIFEPLNYETLEAGAVSDYLTLPLVVRNAYIQDSDGVVENGCAYTVRAQLITPYSSDVIGLVKGGWLPSLFVAEGRILFLDRNVVTEIYGRFRESGRRNNNVSDFIDFLGEKPVKINPYFYALEGNKRRHLTADEVEEQVAEAYRKICEALPNAVVQPDLRSAARGVSGLINDTYDGMERRIEFLLSVNPLLVHTTPRSRRTNIWNQILSAAESSDLGKNSLVVVAALSALVCPQGRNPAKNILKPKPRNQYTKRDAYNALNDFRVLEIMISVLAMFPDTPIAFLTKDRAHALFWVGLNAHNFLWDSEQAASSVEFGLANSPLFPLLSEVELESLYQRE